MSRVVVPTVAAALAILTVPASAPDDRKWNVDAAAASLAANIPFRVIPDLPSAVMRAETMAPYGTVLVTGSVHTVGDALEVLGVDIG